MPSHSYGVLGLTCSIWDYRAYGHACATSALHNGKASIAFIPQCVTEFVNRKIHRKLLLTEIVEVKSTKFNGAMNDYIEIFTISLWPSGLLLDKSDGKNNSKNIQN